MMESNDITGARGEALCYALLKKYDLQAKGALFKPCFLGDKWPMVDFVVELRNAGSTTPFFLVQVKATRLGYTKRENRLRVQVEASRVRGLIAYPAPTYLVGIDDVEEKGYIVSANGENLTDLSSFSTAFPINSANSQRLWNEVNAYWTAPSLPKLVSSFCDAKWR